MKHGIQRPIFIIGVARSGTTVFYNLLATHPEVAWFSNYSNQYRTIPQTALLHRLLDVPLLGEKIKQNIINRSGAKLTPRPNEGEEIYQEVCNFPYNVSTIEAGQYDEQEEKITQVIRNHLKYTGRRFFLSKQTANNRRLNLINHIFPDARFVHIIRDGRAVANSIIKVDWWPEIDLWWLDKKVADWEGDHLPLALQYWEKTVAEITETIQAYGDRSFEIRYEDLCQGASSMMKNVINFLELSPDKKYFERLPDSLHCMNYKWKQEFTDAQKSLARDLIGPTLNRLGYLTD